MNIAIVDDEIMELRAAEFYIRKFIKKNYPELESEINIQTFSCANDFFNVFNPGLFQLIILDIMMPEIDGLQTAQVIRARGDDDANIVFLTANDSFVMNGYRVFAIGYFIKPLSQHEDDFINTFDYIFNKISQKSPQITLNVKGNEIPVRFRNIFYVEIDYHHRLCVHLADGKNFVTNNNYTEVFEILSQDERFLECYHRIIINMDYIKSMEQDDFAMLDGKSIPISQRKKREVKVKYMRYLANK